MKNVKLFKNILKILKSPFKTIKIEKKDGEKEKIDKNIEISDIESKFEQARYINSIVLSNYLHGIIEEDDIEMINYVNDLFPCDNEPTFPEYALDDFDFSLKPLDLRGLRKSDFISELDPVLYRKLKQRKYFDK